MSYTKFVICLVYMTPILFRDPSIRYCSSLIHLGGLRRVACPRSAPTLSSTAVGRRPSHSILPLLRYVYILLSRSLIKRGDNTGVVNSQDFLYLLSVKYGFSLNLGYTITDSLHDHEMNPWVEVIFTGSLHHLLVWGWAFYRGQWG